MNNISINELSSGLSFTEDSFILDDLFFIPKNFPILDYHIKLLRNWNIDRVYTDGTITSTSASKLIKEKEDKFKELNKALSDENEISQNKKNILEEKASEPEIKIDEKIEDDSLIELKVQNIIKTNALLDNSINNFFELYKKWIKQIIQIFGNILENKIVDKEWVKKLILEIISNVNKNRNNALMLFGKKIEGILFIFTQTIETVILAYIIGDSMNLSQLELSNLSIAALFHDIGMIKIPKTIIEKKEALNQQEISIIKVHTAVGYKCLREVKYSAIIASGALQHHERIDGKGYPNGLTGDKITRIAKIISVVDAYCAAISSKPFRESPLHAKEVIQDLLRSGGIAYDANVLKELIKNISFYPIGSMILLSNNKPARVVGTSGVAMKPIIKLIDTNMEGEIIDLSKDSSIYIKGLYTKKNNM